MLPSMSKLVEIAREIGAGHALGPKPLAFYELYARYFPGSDSPITLLELGVHTGESLKIWASYFSAGKVIGLDLARPGPDFSGWPNITYEIGDQADAMHLSEMSARHAPAGYDIVIDDASHTGWRSQVSYTALFPRLKPGGLYIVEDWGTGYYDDWPDGGHYQKISSEPVDGLIPKRMPSHDFGMVGFVKSLFDEVAGDHLRPNLSAPPSRADTIEFMHVYKTSVIIKKI
jgi:SAM-dependent methyltransferase